MFPELASNPAGRLPDDPGIGQKLIALASGMLEQGNHVGPDIDSTIPAAFTYFGQFIDHDMTLMDTPGDSGDLAATVVRHPDPAGAINNRRSGLLDLDSVYGTPAPPDPADPSRLLVGKVTRTGNRPLGKDDFNDLPRQGRSGNLEEDRAALTGDPRNDENLIVAQLHLAFLRAHNSIVGEGASFDEARARLSQMYQSIVLTEYLPHIIGDALVDDIVANGGKWFSPASEDDLFMPIEFSLAAYRFGHSMVRGSYNINENFGETGKIGKATLHDLFTFTALSGDIGTGPGGGFDTLPENWIVEWGNLLPVGDGNRYQRARLLDTRLAPPLKALRDVTGRELSQPIAAQLATRNLLRGFRFGLPSGQAVAARMGAPILSGDSLLAALPQGQRTLVKTLEFHERTPLWFYILAEAGDPKGGNGNRLGPVGGRIVGETIIGFIKFSPYSILSAGSGGGVSKHTLLELLQLARCA